MSESLFVPLGLGLVLGAGVWLILAGLFPRPRPLKVLLAELDTPYRPLEPATAGEVMSRTASQWSGATTPEVERDLAALGMTAADYAKAKLQNSLVLVALAVAAYVLVLLGSGEYISPLYLAGGVLVAAVSGWFSASRLVQRRAARLRDEIDRALVVYLGLVATQLAAGAGTNEALLAATRYGSGPGFTLVRDGLKQAQLTNTSPWAAFAEIAGERGLVALDEVSAAVELAGTSGARVRTSLLTKAEALRKAELARSEADAASASESMGAPVGLMTVAFAAAIGFPGVAALLAI